MILDNFYRCFYVLFAMEMAGIALFPVMLILRFLLQNIPKKYTVWMWRLYFLRLICPLAISSPFSIAGSLNRAYHRILGSIGLTMKEEQGFLNSWSSVFMSDIETSLSYRVCAFAWLIGMAVFLVTMGIQQTQIRQEIGRGAEQLNGKIYQSAVQVPVMTGCFRLRYYLPRQTEAKQLPYLLAHFEAQRRRKSHWWRIFGFAVLVLHWFNPLLWWAYSLAKQDEEMACDDRAVKSLETGEQLKYAQALINLEKDGVKIPFTVSVIFEGNLKKRSVRMLYYRPMMAGQRLYAGLLMSLFCFLLFFLRPLQMAWDGGTWGLGANAAEDARISGRGDKEQKNRIIAQCQTMSSDGLERVLSLLMDEGEQGGDRYSGEFTLELRDPVGELLYEQSLNRLFQDYGITENPLIFSKDVSIETGDYNNDGVQELLIGQQVDWTAEETAKMDGAVYGEEESGNLLHYRYLILNIGEQNMTVLSAPIPAAGREWQESTKPKAEEGIKDLFYVPVPGGRNYYIWNQDKQKYFLETVTQEILNQHKAASNGDTEIGVSKTHTLKNDAGEEVMLVGTKSDTTGSPAIQDIQMLSGGRKKQMEQVEGYFCALEWATEEDASTGRYAVLTYNGSKAQTFIIYDVEKQSVYYSQEDGNGILARAFQQYNGNTISFAEGGVVLYSLQSHNEDKEILTISFAANADGGITVRGSYQYHMKDGGITNLSYSQAADGEEKNSSNGTGTQKPAGKTDAPKKAASPGKTAAPKKADAPDKTTVPKKADTPKKTAKPKITPLTEEPNGPVGSNAPWSIDDWDRYLAENWGM